MAKKRKKKRSSRKGLVKFAKFIILLILLAGTSVLLAMSPAFNIQKISVSGNSVYSEEDIIRTAGVIKGENGFGSLGPGIEHILSLRYAAAEQNIINKMPYIKDAVVKYIVPDTIRISLLEREPFCFIQYFGTYILADREGFVIDSVQAPEGLPVIRGMEVNGLELGHALLTDDFTKFERVVQIIDAMEKSDEESVTGLLNAVDYFEISGKELHFMLDGRIIVKIDDGNEAVYTIELLREIIIKKIQGNEKGILDFTEGKNPIFIPEG